MTGWGVVQIVTSAIAYDPIGWGQMSALDKASGYDTKPVYPHEPKLYGGMGQLFKNKKASGSIRFANRNNFLEIEVRTPHACPAPLFRSSCALSSVACINERLQ